MFPLASRAPRARAQRVDEKPQPSNGTPDPPRAADVTRATRAMATARNLMLAGATAVRPRATARAVARVASSSSL